ncbi:MAG: GNAT family protein [Bacteroidota bacterium]
MVSLTPFQHDNIYQHLEWNNDPELNRLDNALPFVRESLGEFKQRFDQMIDHPLSHHRDFEIHTADGALIGVVSMAHIDAHNRHCLLSITIGNRDYWGRGYGRATMDLALAYCFRTLNMHRVYTESFEYNTSWQRLVEGSGFSLEGTERDYLYQDGQFWDRLVHSMLEPEYQARYEAEAVA